MKTDPYVFKHQVKRKFKNLMSSMEIQMLEYIDVYLDEYEKHIKKNPNAAVQFELDDVNDIAIFVFIGKLKKVIEEAEQLQFYEREIKPILKPKK